MGLRISREKWQHDIGHSGLPRELVGLLKELISAHLYGLIPPLATQLVVGLAQEHLQDPIWIDDQCFNVMLYVPANSEQHRTFFALVRHYPHGELKHLSEVGDTAPKASLLLDRISPRDVDISQGLGDSSFNKSEAEQVACNIIVISRNRHNQWSPFTWEQYQNRCHHDVEQRERAVLINLVESGHLTCVDDVYQVTDDFIVALWKFVTNK